MLSIFAPRYVKEGRNLLKHARKLLHYKRDLLSTEAVSEIEGEMRKLETAVHARDRAAAEESTIGLETVWTKRIPPERNPAWRENCEVFLVAIIIALGVRTYFLQPFTIPTGSMQPTLNGIIGHETPHAAPNVLTRIAHMLVLGRSYVDVVSKADDIVLRLDERKRFVFFTATRIVCENNSYNVRTTADVLMRDFKVAPGREYRAGEPIVRGYTDAGDHVFVNKLSYNFRRPARGEVFVFNTQQITMITKPGMPSQFYIKRLAGVPGDELRIATPELFINGARAVERGLARVMSQENGYRGYAQGPAGRYLSAPGATKTLRDTEYFALGDNSYNSLDSRFWGGVPERNLMGCGSFVYWPFGRHWGLIR